MVAVVQTALAMDPVVVFAEAVDQAVVSDAMGVVVVVLEAIQAPMEAIAKVILVVLERVATISAHRAAMEARHDLIHAKAADVVSEVEMVAVALEVAEMEAAVHALGHVAQDHAFKLIYV